MKKFLFAGIVVAAVAGTAVYLAATTPSASREIRFPLSASDRELLGSVPAGADSFALVPSAAALENKLTANPVTREAMRRLAVSQALPWPWMVGRADLLVWHEGKRTSYLLRLDPFRSFLVRAYLLAAGENAANLFLAAPEGPRIEAAELDRLAALGNRLPPGDALVVQRKGRRGAFPPIGRPAVSSVSITPDAMNIVSVAARSNAGAVNGAAERQPFVPRFARGAMITGTFAEPPRILEDMNRLGGGRSSSLLRDGGSVVVYEVDAGKLLPRPHEVIVLPATPERRAELQRLAAGTLRGVGEAAGFRIETEEAGGQLLVAFDSDSLGRYRSDSFDDAELPANSWSVAIDPARAVPVLGRLGSNAGLRYLAPRIFRSARDLETWVAPLRAAKRIEAGLTAAGGTEELRVRVRAK